MGFVARSKSEAAAIFVLHLSLSLFLRLPTQPSAASKAFSLLFLRGLCSSSTLREWILSLPFSRIRSVYFTPCV
ncbi:hypothetical protein GLYMA_12G227850v4 [Glycine max]|nr:hypothetical protein GLYMA_12G227850v4 [Glycine max]KAH1144485.1 hypothetical protein GYH30_034627 [Glycine max]